MEQAPHPVPVYPVEHVLHKIPSWWAKHPVHTLALSQVTQLAFGLLQIVQVIGLFEDK
jgi:uncharacterized membrane protein (DUF2068 family)